MQDIVMPIPLKRSTSYFEDVLAFHRKFDLPAAIDEPALPTPHVVNYRVGFLMEEATEIITSQSAEDLPGVADGLVDLMYVIAGMAAFCQLDLDDAWESFRDKSDTPDLGSYYADTLGMAMRPYPEKPPLLLPQTAFQQRMSSVISSISMTFRSMVEGGDHLWHNNFVHLTHSTLRLAADMRLPFDALWDEVQRANMSKVRTKSAEEAAQVSGRKSAFDVIKPEGWQPPQIERRLRENGWEG